MVPWWPCNGGVIYKFLGVWYVRVRVEKVRSEVKKESCGSRFGKFGNGRAMRMGVGVCKLRKYRNGSIGLGSFCFCSRYPGIELNELNCIASSFNSHNN